MTVPKDHIVVCSACAANAGWANQGTANEFSSIITRDRCVRCGARVGLHCLDRGRILPVHFDKGPKATPERWARPKKGIREVLVCRDGNVIHREASEATAATLVLVDCTCHRKRSFRFVGVIPNESEGPPEIVIRAEEDR